MFTCFERLFDLKNYNQIKKLNFINKETLTKYKT